MKNNTSKNRIIELLSLADIQINGSRPWDIKVHNENFYSRALSEGALGAGESYMDKWWDCERLDEFSFHIIKADLQNIIRSNIKLLSQILFIKTFNRQTHSDAFSNSRKHYDHDKYNHDTSVRTP